MLRVIAAHYLVCFLSILGNTDFFFFGTIILSEESVLRTEMAGLESQEEDAPKRVLFYKPMSWLGQIRPHRRDESWSTSL